MSFRVAPVFLATCPPVDRALFFDASESVLQAGPGELIFNEVWFHAGHTTGWVAEREVTGGDKLDVRYPPDLLVNLFDVLVGILLC